MGRVSHTRQFCCNELWLCISLLSLWADSPKGPLREEAPQVWFTLLLVALVTRHLHHRATVRPYGSHRQYLPVTNTHAVKFRKRKKGFIGGNWFNYIFVCVWRSLLYYITHHTLIIECREQANMLLNLALMSNMSTSLRVTITLIRVLSSVPAPCNKHINISWLYAQ